MDRAPKVRHYDAQYDQFASELYADVRRVAFGQDIGQNGWLTEEEHALFIRWLDLSGSSSLVDIACGSGGPTLRIAQLTGCRVEGLDLHHRGVATANAAAGDLGLADRASFRVGDAARQLPYASDSFDGLICIDAVNHLPDRAAVFREWFRILKPGGRLVFTDPIIVSGALTNEEIAIRSSIGFFLFVPPGYDERLLAQTGFESIEAQDRTDNMAESAQRWCEARAARGADLQSVEGQETYAGQQTFLEVAARLARERRLSRCAFRAVKPLAEARL
jgi:SAM-dependent methyltransferase